MDQNHELRIGSWVIGAVVAMLDRLKRLYRSPPAERPLPSAMSPAVLAALLRRTADGAELGYPPELPFRLREAAQWPAIVSARSGPREHVWPRRETACANWPSWPGVGTMAG